MDERMIFAIISTMIYYIITDDIIIIIMMIIIITDHDTPASVARTEGLLLFSCTRQIISK